MNINISEKVKSIREKLRETDWKKLVGTKAFITVGCIVVICVAVLVSTLIGKRNGETPAGEDGNKVLGNTLLVDAESKKPDTAAGDESAAEEDFFAMAIINRTQVRDSALEVLREIASNPETLPDAKEKALSSIAQVADDMSAEANIETLVKSKGIGECVAVISGSNCSVIVNKSGLTDPEVTQITDIVCETTGFSVPSITVIEAQK